MIRPSAGGRLPSIMKAGIQRRAPQRDKALVIRPAVTSVSPSPPPPWSFSRVSPAARVPLEHYMAAFRPKSRNHAAKNSIP